MSYRLQFFWISGSPYSWRVLLGLQHKGIAFESHMFATGDAALDSPDLRAVNVRGIAPTLVTPEGIIGDSAGSLAYLDRVAPRRPLFGKEASEAGRIWHQVFDFINYCEPYSKAIVKSFYAGVQEQRRDAIAEDAIRVRAELARIDAVIGDDEWFVGNRMTAADIVAYPFVKSLVRIAMRPEAASFDLDVIPSSTRLPSLGRWLDAFEGLEIWAKTYPPTWER